MWTTRQRSLEMGTEDRAVQGRQGGGGSERKKMQRKAIESPCDVGMQR